MKPEKYTLKNSTIWNTVLFVLATICIIVLSLALAIGNGQLNMFYDYFRYPFTFALNYLPILLLSLFFWGISGKIWICFLATSIAVLVPAIGNYYKMLIRNETFSAGDIPYINAGLKVAGDYNITLNVRIITVICAIIAGSIFLALFAPKKAGKRGRIAAICFVCILTLPLWRFIYSSDEIYSSDAIVQRDYDREMYRTASKGFVYPFIHSIKEISATPPEGYDEEQVQSFILSYADDDIPSDNKPNIIAVQLESFCDLRESNIPSINDKAYYYYDALKKDSISGTLIVNVNGGSTIDTEQCFLTGNYKYSKVKEKAPSFAWYLKENGYTTTGGHPFYSVYPRQNTNPLLGFDEYRLCDNYDYPNIDNLEYGRNYSDIFFFDSIVTQYKELIETGKNVFSFNVTMQGHGPYEKSKYLFGDEWFTDNCCSPESKCIVNNYLGSLENTQQYIKHLIDEVSEIDVPTVVLLYGDHKPWLGDNSSVATELGINYDTSTEEGFLNYYATDYILWGNNAAKSACSNSFVGDGPTISVCYLMPYLFKEIGWSGCGFANYLLERMETLNVITSNGLYYNNGAFAKGEPCDELKDIIKEAESIQYLRTKGWKISCS